ncbi:uncharacterized protein LOC118756120 [Rhagoletis pomonella]|uniref:uncharacterized protein LOC118756120 n=1 Tax=Rhagoletis pomonella TaxID=28610 RepID=UPI00177D18F6|nr:uncharacterized protein LOC118756120 [Rhagoletis pomonella]
MWKRTFLMYMMATGKNVKTEPEKIATFLWLIGSQAMEIYNTLFPNDGTTDGILGNQNAEAVSPNSNNNPRSLDDVLKAFDGYCIPKKNILMESFKFHNIVQKEKQPFVEFETELRKQIEFCEYKLDGQSYNDRMLKERIVIGVHDKKLQLKLLEGKDESLQKVIETCKMYEAANAHKALLNTTSQTSVNSVAEQEPKETVNAVARRCYNCGGDFAARHLETCKARDINCRSCGRKGHFQRWCKSKGKQAGNKGTKPDISYNHVKQQQHSLNWEGTE